ncbi:MAG: S8 family serine peptidase, partial [Anaerolineae bacterium]|nr:S8 family serine peptidase [Anaerolineae bacterium]
MNKRLVLLISIFAAILIFTNGARQMLRTPMAGSDEAGEEAVLPVDVTDVFSVGSSESPEKGLTAVTPPPQLLETTPSHETADPPVAVQSTAPLLDVSFSDQPVQDQSNTDFEPQSSNPTISSLLPTPLPTATPLTDESISDLPNVSDDLQALYGQRSSQSMPTIQGPFTQALTTSEDRVEVTLTVSSNQADTVKEAVLSLGGSVTAAYEIWIDAWIPIDIIPQVAALPGVTRVSTPLRTLYDDSLLPLEHAQVVSPLAGSVITQGVALTKADTWHAVNILGDGVKVAIIDFFADYEDAQANGELPASINLFTAYVPLDRSSNHGTAVAEIIYDMAPGAQLTFASADTPAAMAQTIRSLAEAGNQVISSSVGYIGADAGDGIGPLADAIAYARSLGTLYVQSAGNYAYNSHWDGYFQDTDGDNIHEFSSGVETLEFDLVIAAGDARPITIYLRWNDWNAERSGNANQQDYDLELLRWNETSNDWDLIAASTVAQRDPETKPTPFEMLQGSIDGGRYGIRVRRIAASENAVLDLWVLNPEHSSWQGVAPVSARTLTDPAAAPFAFSVAAVNKVVPYSLEFYSSRGPGRGPGGTFDIGADQPRAASFARVDTWTYGAEGFAGTSAATPHVSGLAALVFSSCPTCTPERVQAYLENHTVDMGQSGYDYFQGYGRILLGSPLDLSPLPAGDVSSLINAINTANNVGIGVIHLESAHLYSLLASIEDDVSYGPSGLPVITGDVTIIGNGSIIERDANAPDFRLFRVAETGRLELQNITLRGGQSAGNSSGAGIFNRGLVYATDVTFLENRPSNTYTYAGAIYNDGILYITGSTFSGNSAQLGSSIYNAKTVSVLDSYFYDASYAPLFNGAYEGIITLSGSTVDADSHYGPGIYNDGGKLIIYNSTIRGHGAGIQAWGSTASTTVTNSTISDNKSDGGIVNLGGAELVLDGVLLTHNYNYNDEGGALHNEGTVTITNSTISYNRGGGLYHAPTKPGQNLTINNSCIFRNYRG